MGNGNNIMDSGSRNLSPSLSLSLSLPTYDSLAGSLAGQSGNSATAYYLEVPTTPTYPPYHLPYLPTTTLPTKKTPSIIC